MSLAPGTRLGSYEIVAQIGAGGMGVVYRATDVKLQRDVALKFLHAEMSGEAERNRFLQEARAASALDHPNIGVIHAIEETEDSRLFIVMTYYEGETLSHRLKRGPISPSQAADILRQTARGLAEAHSKGIVHRDVKPSNIMLTRQGAVKLLDFGLAKFLNSEAITHTGKAVGTAVYMSPEQALGRTVDRRTDLWSLGIVLYVILKGSPPFQRDSIPATLLAVAQDPLPPLEDLSPELQSVLYRCLEKDPERRYQYAQDLLSDLEPLASRGEQPTLSISADAAAAGTAPAAARTEASRTPSAAPPATAPAWRRIALWIAAVVVLASGTFSFWKWRNPAVPREKHVVVLPFNNVGGDPANAAIGDGLLETLTSRLSGLEGLESSLWVAPASEVRRRNVQDAAGAERAFGANLVIAGSVQRQTSGVRLTLNLVDTHTLKQLGSAVIDDRLGDFSTLQDNAVDRLARLLEVELKPGTLATTAGESARGAAYESYLKGLSYLQRYDKTGNLDTAIQLFREATLGDSRFALAYAKLAEAERLKSRLNSDPKLLDAAVADAERATTINDQLAPVHVVFGGIHLDAGRYDLAIQQFQRAIQLDPRSAEAHQRLAGAFEAVGRMADAESSLKTAIAFRADYWDGYNSLGAFYIRRSRFAEAAAQFRKVLELTPDNANAWINLGVALRNTGDVQGALKAYEKSIAIAPSYAAYTNLAVAQYGGGNFVQAAGTYEKALGLNGRDWRTWQGLAQAYRAAGLDSRARPATERTATLAEEALKASPNDALLHAFLASAYAHLGEPGKARGQIESSLALAPEDPRVLTLAAGAYEVLGSRSEALKLLRTALAKGLSLDTLQRDPEFESLRQAPAFQALVR